MTTKNPVHHFHGNAPHIMWGLGLRVPAAVILLIVSLATGEPVAAADPAVSIGVGAFRAQSDDQDEQSNETTTPLTGETSTSRSVSEGEVSVPQLQPVGTSSRTVPTETAADDGDRNAEYLRIVIAAAAVVLIVVALSQGRSEPAGSQTARHRTFSH